MGSKIEFKMYSLSTTVREIERVPELLKTIEILEKNGANSIATTENKESFIREIIKNGFVHSSKVDDNILDKIQMNVKLSDDEANLFMEQAKQKVTWAGRLSNYMNKVEPLGLAYRYDNKIKITKLGEFFQKNPVEAINWSLENIPTSNPFKRNLNSFTISGAIAKYVKKMNKTRISDYDLAVLMSIEKMADIDTLSFNYKNFNKALEMAGSISITTIKDYLDEMKRTLAFARISKKAFKGIEVSEWFKTKVEKTIINAKSSVQRFNKINTIPEMINYINSKNWVEELSLDEVKTNYEKIKELAQDFTTEALVMYIDEIKNYEVPIIPNLDKKVKRFVVIEWLFSLLLAKNDKLKVYPRLSLDPNGYPISHAGAGKTDILVKDNNIKIGYEITLITTRNQMLNSETTNLIRHVKSDKANSLIFLAPKIHDDVKMWFKYSNDTEDIEIQAKTFDEFLDKYRPKKATIY